ncbi:unnamed protein product [Boreogadus saida]
MAISNYEWPGKALASLPASLGLRSSLELQLANHSALAVVFQLEYVFSAPLGRDNTPAVLARMRPWLCLTVTARSPLCRRVAGRGSPCLSRAVRPVAARKSTSRSGARRLFVVCGRSPCSVRLEGGPAGTRASVTSPPRGVKKMESEEEAINL